MVFSLLVNQRDTWKIVQNKINIYHSDFHGPLISTSGEIKEIRQNWLAERCHVLEKYPVKFNINKEIDINPQLAIFLYFPT